MTRCQLLLRSAILALLGIAGCVVSPQPSPPLGQTPELDGGRINVGAGPDSNPPLITFSGAPGTVSPPRGVLVITDLDTADSPSIASIAADGSFMIAVPAAKPGDTFRFQAKSDAGRSDPIDRKVTGGGLVPATLSLPCFTITPFAWIPLEQEGDARSLVAHNGCTSAVTVAPPHLRRGHAGLTFSPTAGLDLAAGASTTFTVHAASGATEDEDVLYLDVSAPEAARRAVTITRD